LVESLPSKPPAAHPSVNPAETDVKGVPASGVKGEEQGEKMNDTKVREPDMNNPEERARVERAKRALNILAYGNEQPPGAPDHTLSWGLSQWKIIARADGRSEKTVEGVEGAEAIRGSIEDETFIAKFKRQDLVGVEPGDEVEMTIKGNLYGGTPFEGSDTIRVISKGK